MKNFRNSSLLSDKTNLIQSLIGTHNVSPEKYEKELDLLSFSNLKNYIELYWLDEIWFSKDTSYKQLFLGHLQKQEDKQLEEIIQILQHGLSHDNSKKLVKYDDEIRVIQKELKDYTSNLITYNYLQDKVNKNTITTKKSKI